MSTAKKSDQEKPAHAKGARPKVLSAKELAKAIVARAAEARELTDYLEEQLSRVDEYEAVSVEIQAQMYKSIVAFEEYLYGGDCLGSADVFVQRTALLAYFRHQLNKTFEDHMACKKMFCDMANANLLVVSKFPDPKAALPGGIVKFGRQRKPATIYGDTYNLPVEFPLNKHDIEEFRGLCVALRKRTQEGVQKLRRERMAELNAKVEISPDEALGGKEGLFVLDVPSETVKDKNNPGRKFTHQGCRLLIKSYTLGAQKFLVTDVVNEVGNGGMGVCEKAVRKIMGRRNPAIPVRDILTEKARGLLSHMIIRGFNVLHPKEPAKPEVKPKSRAGKPKARKPKAKK